MAQTEMNDRERGILSKTDREYLVGESDIDRKDSERAVRRRIRERVKNALRDFDLLNQHLESRDREQIFSTDNRDSADERTPRGYTRDAIEFLFLGLTDNSPIEKEGNGHHSPAFELELELGLRNAYRKRDYALHECQLQIESESAPGLEIVNMKLENDIQLRPDEIMLLLETGELGQETVQEFVKKELSDQE